MNEDELKIVESFYKAITKELDERPGAGDEEIEAANTDKPFVTALIYDCMRRIYYSLVLKLPIADPTGAVRAWIGKKLHETKILGPDAESEVTIEYNGVVGRIDEYKDGVLIEKKTTRNIPREPYEHHVRQVEYYTLMLARNGKPVKKAFIVYIDVNTGMVTAFDVTKRLRLVEVVEKEFNEKAQKIQEALKYKILPPKTVRTWPDSDKLICQYCPYFGFCFRDLDYSIAEGGGGA